jgi:hypothetical protein
MGYLYEMFLRTHNIGLRVFFQPCSWLNSLQFPHPNREGEAGHRDYYW